MDMKVLENYKIKKYDKAASNPFREVKVPITLVWIEDKKHFDEST